MYYLDDPNFDESHLQLKLLKHLESYFSQKKNLGRFITPEDYCKDVKKSKAWFYKYINTAPFYRTWLRFNREAPQELKEKVYNKLKVAEARESLRLPVQDGGKKNPVASLAEPPASSKVINAPTMNAEAHVEVLEALATVDHRKGIKRNDNRTIEQIRKEYVLGRPGTYPTVFKICQDLGLINQKGESVTDLTLEMVLDIMEKEDWRTERRQYLARVNDFLDEEKIIHDRLVVTRVKADIETHFKVISNLNMQYFRTGEAKAMNGKKLAWTPDTSSIVALSEAYRRLCDGNALIKQQILVQQNGGNTTVSTRTDQKDKDMPLLGEYIEKLRTLAPAQVIEESRKLDSVLKMLSNDYEKNRDDLLKDVEYSNLIPVTE